MPIRTQLILYTGLLICIASSCQKKGEDCIYLIPKNFEGNILLVFEQKEGADTLYEGKTRVYRFDTTGILKTKFAPNYGIQRKSYYYVDSIGGRFPIKYVISAQLRDTDEVVCINHEAGSGFDKKKSARRHFELMTIAKEKNIDSIGNQRDFFSFKKLE
jgi:hypothetical protein